MDKAADPELGRLRLIWIVMLATLAVYGGVAALLGPAGIVDTDPELVHWLSIFLGIFSGCELLTALLLKQLVAFVSGGSYTAYCLIRWSLVESLGCFGLVLFLLGGGWGMLAFFLLPSFLILSILRPGHDDKHRFEQILK